MKLETAAKMGTRVGLMWGRHRDDRRLFVAVVDDLQHDPNAVDDAVVVSQAAICVAQFIKERP